MIRPAHGSQNKFSSTVADQIKPPRLIFANPLTKMVSYNLVTEVNCSTFSHFLLGLSMSCKYAILVANEHVWWG